MRGWVSGQGPRRALTFLALLAVICLAPLSAQSTFESAASLVREGDFVAALEVADAQQDPLQKAQARLHVLHYAGDLDGALNAGRQGLAIDPDDAWLLENASYIALSLGLGKPAVAWLEALEQRHPGQAPEWMMEEALTLRMAREVETKASTRAKTVITSALALLLAAWFLSARRAARAARPSS